VANNDFFKRMNFSMPAVDKLNATIREQQAVAADISRTIGENNAAEAERQEYEDERMERMIELIDATSRATAELASVAGDQRQENRRLRLLTKLLSAAVIFDIVQGSFDDHNAGTAIGAALIAVAAVVSLPAIGGAISKDKQRSSRTQAESSGARNASK
jgi:hypothetical protein